MSSLDEGTIFCRHLRAAALIEASIKRDAGRPRRCLIVPSLFAGFGGRPSQLELAGNTMNDEILVDSESLSLAAMTVSENCSVSILLPKPMFTILQFGWINQHRKRKCFT
jgi:hypothetical protein